MLLLFSCDRVCKPGSVLTAIYLDLQLLTGSSHLSGTVGQTYCPTHGVAPDRVYSVKPMSPWAGCALTAPFHPCRTLPTDRQVAAVYLCCTCPEVTLGGRYPLSLPCGARTFLIANLSISLRDRLSYSPVYFNDYPTFCQPDSDFSFRCDIILKNIRG